MQEEADHRTDRRDLKAGWRLAEHDRERFEVLGKRLGEDLYPEMDLRVSLLCESVCCSRYYTQ